jgi:hypothetical protein
MFNLNFKMELSDLLLLLGILIITVGLYFVYMPAAVIFLGIALVILAFLVAPRPPKDNKKGGD